MSLSSPLVQAFCDHPDGLCGQHEPALIITQIPSIEERLSLLAFGIAADAGQSDSARWSALAQVHDHWLFNPSQAAYKTSPQIQEGFQQLGIKAPKHLARVWWQISRGVQGRAKGSWLALFDANQKDALHMQNYLRDSATTFPVLSGPVLSARWLDLVHRAGGVKLASWESLRMSLPKEFKAEALIFGVAEDEVHPAFISATQVWKQSCQRKAIPCGLTSCPNT